MQSDMHLLNMKPAFLMTTRNINHGNMASSSSFFVEVLPRPSHNNLRRSSLKFIKAHSYKDEGRSSNSVDANLRVLRERIQVVRNKERLERCCTSEQGWNYTPVYTSHHKKEAMLIQYFHLIGLLLATAGLPIVFGTFSLCMFSLFLHLTQ